MSTAQQAAMIYHSVAITAQRLRDPAAEAAALCNLGWARYQAGEYADAGELKERALALFEEAGDLWGQANTLHVMAYARRMTKGHAEALGLGERALALYKQLGDRLGEANVLGGF
ncbi:tetratricopeptide repeat protein [Spongiactinospora sp. 9N601]|uniref:tetratricopeptide repeat protein n=1 Tax=Spongiactinospora sp. 9N601 TaxID=3375149 RepID=UPI0037A6A57D